MIVIRYDRNGKTAYATVPEDGLVVRYVERQRVAETRQTPIGPITRVEGTGTVHRDRVTMTFGAGRDAAGHLLKDYARASLLHRMRLLDYKKHVRVLAEADETALQVLDGRIEQLERDLARLRADRADTLQKAWRRAGPLGLGEIEDRAKAELAEGRKSI